MTLFNKIAGGNEGLTILLDDRGGTGFIQAYAQWKYRINEKLTFHGGLHANYLGLNRNYNIEPRAALLWEPTARHKMSISAGKHSKPEHVSTYFLGDSVGAPVKFYPNKKLDFITSNHYVLGHDFFIKNNMRLKTELYYQDLQNVWVEKDPESLETLLNTSGIWDLLGVGAAENSGTGRNVGMDVTFERFFSNDYYFLITASLFDSKYTVRGNTFNTKYNNRYLLNALYGREWRVGKNRNNILAINGKFKLQGGNTYNAYDKDKIEKLRSEFGDLTWEIVDYHELIVSDQRYSAQAPAYYRFDIGVSFKKNTEKATHSFMLDIQNATNHQNVYRPYFDMDADRISYWYQAGMIPILNYRIEF
jgi:hypothetical protein